MAADEDSLMLRRRRPVFGCFCLSMLLLVIDARFSTALAEPEISINRVYYSIEGDNADAILADIRTKSPVQNNGRRHTAQTSWHVNWQFWWNDNGDVCKITRVTTTLDVVYTLPRLKTKSAMSEDLLARWDAFYAALFSHELGHKDLGVRAANEIENLISDMGPRDACSRLEQDANRIARNVIDKYSRIEKEYDRSTNHGINTGAVFP